MLSCVGCRYERIVSYNPPLASLPGAVTQTAPVRNGQSVGSTGSAEIIIEHEDGSIELVSRNALQLLTHIRRLIAAQGKEVPEAQELFVEQLLSTRTKEEFIERGYDPAEAYIELRRRERDVMKLLARMPMGEFTPGLFLKPLERNAFRLAAPPRASEGLNWTFVDVVVERGVWKLRWFG
jgi:hypothetical protein